MRAFAVLLWIALVLAPALGSLSACEKTPTCSEAVQRWWATADDTMQPWAVAEGIERDLAQCLELQDQAQGTDCMAAHVSWRECLYNRVGFDSFSGTPECAWRLERLQACLDGRVFEQSCDDDQDNDADGLVDCLDPDCSTLCWRSYYYTSTPQSMERALDLLFVIDNSSNMANETANPMANFPAFLTPLKDMVGGLPHVHVGVTTTDPGTGLFDITHCEEVGGDAGSLLVGNCANPTGGAPYLVDVAPQGCGISMEPDNTCSAHTCSQDHCGHEPTTNFVQDSITGCPRCRNYFGESLEDALRCISAIGTFGCGFEQPLEAMKKALEPANTANSGFLRHDAFLTVLLITNEDDCSASDPQLSLF